VASHLGSVPNEQQQQDPQARRPPEWRTNRNCRVTPTCSPAPEAATLVAGSNAIRAPASIVCSNGGPATV